MKEGVFIAVGLFLIYYGILIMVLMVTSTFHASEIVAPISIIVSGILLMVAGIAYPWASSSGRANLPEDKSPHIKGLCVYCNYPITIRGSRFCPGCGAKLITLEEGAMALASQGEGAATEEIPAISAEQAESIATALRVPRRQRAGKCMVCNLDLSADDALAWCPHCGSPAHRTHLVEWIHVKETCPVCGKHIDEEELVEHLSRADISSRKRKRTRKTVKPRS